MLHLDSELGKVNIRGLKGRVFLFFIFYFLFFIFL